VFSNQYLRGGKCRSYASCICGPCGKTNLKSTHSNNHLFPIQHIFNLEIGPYFPKCFYIVNSLILDLP
jgi:hypothetical protein